MPAAEESSECSGQPRILQAAVTFPLASGDGKVTRWAVHMITRLFSAALRGVDVQEVEVEVNARGADKPVIMIVGKTLSNS